MNYVKEPLRPWHTTAATQAAAPLLAQSSPQLANNLALLRLARLAHLCPASCQPLVTVNNLALLLLVHLRLAVLAAAHQPVNNLVPLPAQALPKLLRLRLARLEHLCPAKARPPVNNLALLLLVHLRLAAAHPPVNNLLLAHLRLATQGTLLLRSHCHHRYRRRRQVTKAPPSICHSEGEGR